MKKVRLFSLAAIVALSSFIAPQTASAYKYHVTLPDGSHEVFDAKNSAEAVHYFREHYNEGVLMKRPNGAQGGLSVADGCRCLTKELDMIAC